MRVVHSALPAALVILGLFTLSCESVKVEGPTDPNGGGNVTVSSVTVTPSTFTISAGATQQLSATVRGSNGSTLTNKTITWTSSNSSVATVSSGGLVNGLGAGSVTITASVEGVSGTSSGTVGNPTPVITSLSPNTGNYGQSNLTLSVVGSGFISSSVVRVDNVDRGTQYVSATQLQTTIREDELDSPGFLQITVFNPSPGGGASSAVAFEVGLCTKGTLSPGDVQNNTLANSDCKFSDDTYFHTWEFEATQGQLYQAVMHSDFVDPYVIVVDEAGAVVGQDDDSDYEVDSRFTFKAGSTGTYLIYANTYDAEETGAYSIRLSAPQELTLNNPAVGQLPVAGQGSSTAATGDGRYLVEGVPVDRFGLLVDPDMVLMAEARPAGTTSSLNPAMELFEAVEEVSPAGGDNDTDPILANGGEVILSLPDDDRYASIDLYGANGSTGSFEVAVQNCRLFALTVGGSANGTTSTASDCALAGAGSAAGWPSVVIGFFGSAGQSVVLSATSTWDNFLLLLGEDGTYLDFDDDSGGGTDAQIAITLPDDGIYLALLAPYFSGTTGSFAISLTAGSGAPPEATAGSEFRDKEGAGIPISAHLSPSVLNRGPRPIQRPARAPAPEKSGLRKRLEDLGLKGTRGSGY